MSHSKVLQTKGHPHLTHFHSMPCYDRQSGTVRSGYFVTKILHCKEAPLFRISSVILENLFPTLAYTKLCTCKSARSSVSTRVWEVYCSAYCTYISQIFSLNVPFFHIHLRLYYRHASGLLAKVYTFLVKKFLRLHRTQRFILASTKAQHWNLS